MDRKAESDRLKAFWQDQLAAWSESGQSQTAYCQAKDLNPHQFSYWKRKLLGKPAVPQKPSGFIPARHDRTDYGLSLTLPSGLVIRGIDQGNLAVVGQLLQQLR